jgi:hypothetical protein
MNFVGQEFKLMPNWKKIIPILEPHLQARPQPTRVNRLKEMSLGYIGPLLKCDIDTPTSLLQYIINYGSKKWYSLCPVFRFQIIKKNPFLLSNLDSFEETNRQCYKTFFKKWYFFKTKSHITKKCLRTFFQFELALPSQT